MITNSKLLFFTLFALSTSVVSANANEQFDIVVNHVWISEAPPSVAVLAAYAEIKNHSTKTRKLIAVTSPDFNKIELHLSKIINDTATMKKQTFLTVPANEAVKLIPGAYHLMLFHPHKRPKAGDKAMLNFRFDNGEIIKAVAIVKKRNPGQTSHNHHNHHNH